MNLFGLIIEGLVAALLVVTVGYCTLLNRRLKALHTGEDGLRDVIAGLDRATERAQASLAELKTMGAAAATSIKTERDKADELLNELKLMVGSADRVADRLAGARDISVPQPAEPRAAAPQKDPPPSGMFHQLRQAR